MVCFRLHPQLYRFLKTGSRHLFRSSDKEFSSMTRCMSCDIEFSMTSYMSCDIEFSMTRCMSCDIEFGLVVCHVILSSA